MKIELKRISYNARLSQETAAFAADVYVDGKKAGSAENSGHGGNTNVHLHLLSAEERAKVEAWCNAQPPHVYPASGDMKEFSVPYNLEQAVDNFLYDWLEKRDTIAQYKRWCKKSLVFRLKGDEKDKWRTLKGPYSQAAKDWVTKKYGAEVEEILNETLPALIAASK